MNPNNNIMEQLSGMMSNPQIQSILALMKSSGKSPKELFYETCKQKGIDPESILNQLR